MVNHWHKFPVADPSLEVFQTRLDEALEQSGLVEGVHAHCRVAGLDGL